jgi:methionine synthase I (cobalamin-dependent)
VSDWQQLAGVCLEQGAVGIALETFVDPVECAAAVVAVRTAFPSVRLAACLVPREDGRLLSGAPPGPAVARLLENGASIVGFNCASPMAISRALDACEGIAHPVWLKPSAGLPFEEWTASLCRLAERGAYLGGCCGVSPEQLDALGHSFRAHVWPR